MNLHLTSDESIGTTSVPCPNCGGLVVFDLYGEPGPTRGDAAVITVVPVITRPHRCPSRDYSPESEAA